MAGWIKLHRCIKDNYLWEEKPFSRGQAWVDLLILANHKDGIIRVRGIQVEVKRGQVGYSILTLADRWGWSRGKVQRFLDELETVQQIVQQKNRLTSLFTITKYDDYQSHDTTEQTTDGTTNGQQTDTNKKVKKEKKKPLSCADALRLSSLLATNILSTYPDHRELRTEKREVTIERWAVDIDKLIRIDSQPAEEIEKVIKWVGADDFWKNNILSGNTLRKQWDKLKIKMIKATPKAEVYVPVWPVRNAN